MLVLICNPTTNFDSSSQATSLPRDANLSAETSLRAELDAAERASSAIFQAMHMLTHPSSKAKRNFDGDIYPKKMIIYPPLLLVLFPIFCRKSCAVHRLNVFSHLSPPPASRWGSEAHWALEEQRTSAWLRLGENDLRPPWNSLELLGLLGYQDTRRERYSTSFKLSSPL
jgi:hypothetical protein